VTDITQTHDAGEPGPVVKTTPEEGGVEHSHDHPSELQYVYVAIFLAVITGAEVAVYYARSLGSLLVLILVVLSVVKFSTVVLWFMHLRFDSRLFRRLFVTGLVLALCVYTIVLTTFHVWTR
jgi:cytochrome c oxidase subunit 4